MQNTASGRRRQLRNNPTEPEKRLWLHLKGRQLGVKFRRQHSIGSYIVDFYCAEQKLVIELDGESHFTESAQCYDTKRDQYLKAQGCRTLRYLNPDVMHNLNGVLEDIAAALQTG